MVILYFGDIFARSGRQAITAVFPALKEKYKPDFILANAENLAGGRGINKKTLKEMFDLGFHGFTSGNHIWDNRDIHTVFDTERRLFRPANYPSVPGARCPGQGFGYLESNGKKLFVINLAGRIFMEPLDCPFHCVDQILSEQSGDVPIFVDMHAETTSEKYALGWYLAGRVSAVVGTHTHIQTSDNRVLPGDTAYITDAGMVGSFDSVIGMKRTEVIKKFLTRRPYRYQPASENPGFGCVVIRIDEKGRAQSILRILQTVSDFEKTGGSDWPT